MAYIEMGGRVFVSAKGGKAIRKNIFISSVRESSIRKFPSLFLLWNFRR